MRVPTTAPTMLATIHNIHASFWLFQPIAIGGPLIAGFGKVIEAIVKAVDREFVTNR